MGRAARVVVTSVLLVACVLGVAGWRHLDRVVIAAVTPSAPFDPTAAPPPPDYGDSAAWSALPSRADAGDAQVATLPAASDPPGDVFYVHPTSYVGRAWNASLDDAALNEATDRGATRIQASAFAGCCAIWAPRYRQANMSAFTDPTPDGARAIALAGDDVIAAFRAFVAARDPARPFVLAGHSQGSILASRLLAEEIAPGPLRERLVAAYLIGSPLTEAAAVLPVCDRADRSGCVVAWNARSADYDGGLELAPAEGRLCVNPLSWRHDEAFVPATRNRGAVFFEGDATPAPRPGFASARCERGVLRVDELAGAPPRDLASRVLDHALGEGNHHAIEFGLFFADLRENAIERVAAFAR